MGNRVFPGIRLYVNVSWVPGVARAPHMVPGRNRRLTFALPSLELVSLHRTKDSYSAILRPPCRTAVFRTIATNPHGVSDEQSRPRTIPRCAESQPGQR